MTSKKSFWAKFIGNNGQKVWMWIICFISMLVLYPGVMLVYFNRISGMYLDDTPFAKRILDYNMNLAVSEAIGIRDNAAFVVFAFVIALGIFGYVNNRSKVDVYKSVPVSSKTSFFGDYISGVVIVFANYIFAIICTLILAAGWGYLPIIAVKQCLFTSAVNLLMFLFYYSIAIIAIMITGNMFVALGTGAVICFIVDLYAGELDTFKYTFFKTADSLFGYDSFKFAPVISYNESLWEVTRKSDMSELLSATAPSLIHLVIGCIVLIPLSYFSFKKRPAEAMTKAIYLKPAAIIIKIAVAVYTSIGVGEIIYNSSSESTSLMILAAVVWAIIIGMAFDVLYAFDIKAFLKSWWSTLVGIAVTLLILFAFITDFIGYDEYLPSDKNVESYAMNVYLNGYAENFEYVTDDYSLEENCTWIDEAQYYLDNMYLTDIDSIRRLAEIAIEKGYYDDDTAEFLEFNVHYRRKGLWDVNRKIKVDPLDEESVKLLDNIIGSEEWAKGVYQIISDRDMFLEKYMTICYSNGVNSEVSGVDMEKLIDAYAKDEEKFTFSKGFNETPVGKIVIYPSQYWMYMLPVYEDYENTLSLFEEDGSLLSNEFTSEDVTNIRVINYHNEVWETNGNSYEGKDPTVTVDVTDPEKMDELLEYVTSNELPKVWGVYDDTYSNYTVEVFFDGDYLTDSYYDYIGFSFTGPVPQWIVDLTALG